MTSLTMLGAYYAVLGTVTLLNLTDGGGFTSAVIQTSNRSAADSRAVVSV